VNVPGDLPFVVDAPLNRRRRLHPPVEHDRELTTDVRRRESAELLRAGVVEAEADEGRLYSSICSCAARRSRPVTAGTRRTA
jgi:hypothetical protein